RPIDWLQPRQANRLAGATEVSGGIVKTFRPIAVATLGLSVVIATIRAAQPSEPIPLPRERPASQTAKPEAARLGNGPQQSPASRAGPLCLAPDAEPAPAPNAALPAIQPPSSIKSLAAPRIVAPFAIAATTATSPLDLSTVKQALDLVRKNRQDEATATANSI